MDSSRNINRSTMREVRSELLVLHKAVLDAERARYEREQGHAIDALAYYRLLTQDPAFGWLQPLTRLIVDIDERLSDKAPIDALDVVRMESDLRSLFASEANAGRLGSDYARALQESPDVAMAHAAVVRLLAAMKC